MTMTPTSWFSYLKTRWAQHLTKNNMTYTAHFSFAAVHGARCLRAGVYLIIHACLPCFFPHAGSRLVSRLQQDFVEHRKECKDRAFSEY